MTQTEENLGDVGQKGFRPKQISHIEVGAYFIIRLKSHEMEFQGYQKGQRGEERAEYSEGLLDGYPWRHRWEVLVHYLFQQNRHQEL